MVVHAAAVVVAAAAAKMPVLHMLFRLSPLLWPLNLYLPLARQLPRVCDAASAASALLVFRLRWIVAMRLPGRYRRTLRNLRDELLHHHRSPPRALDDDSIQSLLSVAI